MGSGKLEVEEGAEKGVDGVSLSVPQLPSVEERMLEIPSRYSCS